MLPVKTVMEAAGTSSTSPPMARSGLSALVECPGVTSTLTACVRGAGDNSEAARSALRMSIGNAVLETLTPAHR